MIPSDEDYSPLSSFQFPIPVPAADPTAGTLLSVQFAEDWLPRILGCLSQLMEPTAWDTSDPSTLDLAFDRSNDLLYLFQTGAKVIAPGTVSAYGGATAPAGWLMCDGSAISRTTYADLFAAIGTVYGAGDGLTTFNLPDIRGRSLLGAGSGSGLTPRALGDTGGSEDHILTTAEMPAHSHTDTGHSHTTGNSLLLGTSVPPPLDALGPNPLPAFTGSGSANLTNTGGGDAHPNMPPFLVLNAIIKV